jgi:hypothetical protein
MVHHINAAISDCIGRWIQGLAKRKTTHSQRKASSTCTTTRIEFAAIEITFALTEPLSHCQLSIASIKFDITHLCSRLEHPTCTYYFTQLKGFVCKEGTCTQNQQPAITIRYWRQPSAYWQLLKTWKTYCHLEIRKLQLMICYCTMTTTSAWLTWTSTNQ